MIWFLIKQYYREARPPTEIPRLTVEMIKQDTKGPTFHAKASQTKHLVPFSVELSRKMAGAAGGRNSHCNKLVALTVHLLNFYKNTFGGRPFNASMASQSYYYYYSRDDPRDYYYSRDYPNIIIIISIVIIIILLISVLEIIILMID